MGEKKVMVHIKPSPIVLEVREIAGTELYYLSASCHERKYVFTIIPFVLLTAGKASG
jgi:hypothetical protein